MITSAAVVVVVLVAVVLLSTIGRGGDDDPASAAPSDAASATSAAATGRDRPRHVRLPVRRRAPPSRHRRRRPTTCPRAAPSPSTLQTTRPARSALTLDRAAGAVHREELRQPGRAGYYDGTPLPPAHHRRGPQGAAVRRPDRHRHRRPRLHDPGRGADDARPVAVGRRHGDLPARHRRDGQDRRAELGRQPVLPGLRRLDAAAGLHRLRHDRRGRAGHDRRRRRGRHGRQPTARATASRSPRSTIQTATVS